MSTIEIPYGSSSSGIAVGDGDQLIIDSGGSAQAVTVASGGTITLFGQISDAVVSSGGVVDFGAVVSGPDVVSAGVETAVTVFSGLTLSSGADLYLAYATLESGAVVSVLSGSTASSLTISSGAALLGPGELDGNNHDAGAVDGAAVGGAMYGSLDVLSGGSASGVMLHNGALIIEAGGSATATQMTVGGYDEVFGLASGTVVGGNTQEYVLSGGVASGAVLQGDGAEVISSGGLAVGTLMSLGGGEYVSSGGVASASQVLSLGVEFVLPDGVESGGLIGVGGSVTVDGVLSGATVEGTATIDSDGSVLGGVISSGGVLAVSAGATVQGLTVTPGAVIDLLGVASAVVTLDGQGQFLVSSGGVLVETLGPAASLDGIGAVVQSDGHGGTDIVVGAENLGLTQGEVTSTVDGDTTYYQLFAPDGALQGSVAIYSSGGETVSGYFDSAGDRFASTISQTFGGGLTQRQDFDASGDQLDASSLYAPGGGLTVMQDFAGDWSQTGAVVSTVQGDITTVQDFGPGWNQESATFLYSDPTAGLTVQQDFGPAWNQLSATQVYDNGAGEVTTQYFGADWNQLSATVVQTTGSSVQTQYFGADWNQLSASLVQTFADGDVETQYFDGGWSQTSATLVSHPDALTTITQNFDSSWSQVSADIDRVYGAETIDYTYTGDWIPTGGTTSTALNAETDLIQSFDAQGNLIVGQDHLLVDVQPGLQVFASVPDAPSTYVIHPGDVNGDVFAGFVTAAVDPQAHDTLDFVGYGPSASLTQIDASHWRISAPGLASEVFTLAGSISPYAGDVVIS